MDQTRAMTAVRNLPFRAPRRAHGRMVSRLRHVIWSVLIVWGMFALALLDPLDQFSWLVQSKLGTHKPSGDIVFVSVSENLDDPRLGHRRRELADALDQLERRGVGKVFLDIAFDEPSTPANDAPLARAIADLGPRIVVADQLAFDTQGRTVLTRTIPAIAGSASRVISEKEDTNYFGVKWRSNYGYSVDGKYTLSLASALGGYVGHSGGRFEIDYGFAANRIVAFDLEDLADAATRDGDAFDLAGKTVVIGYDRQASGTSLIIPNGISVPPSYISIFGGETLKSGRTGFIPGMALIGLVGLLLSLLVAVDTSRKRRWIGYGVLAAGIPLGLLACAKLGLRPEASYAAAVLAVYGLFRSRTRWKRRVAMVNQDTGIPTLRALEARLLRDRAVTGHVVIAKVHNYERVLKTLRDGDRSAYILKIVDRLRATDPALAIFAEGHNIGWYTKDDETPPLIEHLEGMRAIFAAPVLVNGHTVDVDITFGLAALEGDPAGRLAAALSAAEETSEAHEPIRAADSGTQSDLLWDISLRARIDEAMEAGEIYCVYQPKIESATKQMVGVEALVRWHDPARGFIQPMHFIQQCEKAGRMEHLTRYVLQSACSAGKLLHFRGISIHVSVNISATLLGDMRVVGIVRNILQATRFDPHFLVLEITETARIADLETASTILGELRALGLRISIDDFGVGAANFETFYALPFDELKIDRVFVANIARDPKARAIVSSIVAMGREARITIVAEGVENRQDGEILTKIGCNELQGYYYSRPISLTNLLEFNGHTARGEAANMV